MSNLTPTGQLDGQKVTAVHAHYLPRWKLHEALEDMAETHGVPVEDIDWNQNQSGYDLWAYPPVKKVEEAAA